MRIGIAIALTAVLTALTLTSAIAQPSVKIQQKAAAYSGVLLTTVTNTAATSIWTTNNLSSTDGRVLYRSLQNVGTNTVLYLIVSPGMTATNAATTNYTGVLSAGSAIRDGLGGKVDLSQVPWKVSLITETGSSVVTAVELTQ
jgi:hypothetical protein